VGTADGAGPLTDLPPLDDLPRPPAPPTDDELGGTFLSSPALYLPAALAWAVVGELAIVIVLLLAILLSG
jgi:hypothetical protein